MANSKIRGDFHAANNTISSTGGNSSGKPTPEDHARGGIFSTPLRFECLPGEGDMPFYHTDPANSCDMRTAQRIWNFIAVAMVIIIAASLLWYVWLRH
jgi:hypothetical protein